MGSLDWYFAIINPAENASIISKDTIITKIISLKRDLTKSNIFAKICLLNSKFIKYVKD